MDNGKENAFPVLYDGDKSEPFYHTGLTKREYFAGLAMQSIVGGFGTHSGGDNHCAEIAKRSILMADELLKQLNNKLTPNTN